MVEDKDRPEGLLDKMERLTDERRRKRAAKKSKPRDEDDDLDLGRIG